MVRKKGIRVDPTDLRTGGQWAVDALAAEGVRHVFGIPGVHNLAIYDALPGQPGIAHILARHEQGAAFMADGYARAGGEPGVVAVTTGPGATNALTPLVESYASSVPVLVLMSDIPAALIGRNLGALHEVPNQIDCFRPVTRWAEVVRDGTGIAAAVQGAFTRLRSRRPGPSRCPFPPIGSWRPRFRARFASAAESARAARVPSSSAPPSCFAARVGP